MHTKEEIRILVQQNIHQIKISEFAGDGGWPNIDAVDVEIHKHVKIDSEEVVYLHILYTVDRAGCCFIPGREDYMRLAKKATLQNNQLKFE
ncbi:hypothetical protein [Wenyingzhuangia sp. 2_MG-2023]|uniref:hypothetical protein n=1 Tax=Wenyingzhuangia sp. 2_MG-2023 TaxID=3062639 RepID=UPI0026E2D529|nr:hypothetical protein [Wenyingzhuangia sp. 2_MG-2023]MDO6737521.1 hypothetical protein [Wenyingzhuangia sp. 2_MG-2023]